MNILSRMVHGLRNGSRAADAVALIPKITGVPCDASQIQSLERMAREYSGGVTSPTAYDYAFIQIYYDYMCGPKRDINGEIYADYRATPEIKERVIAMYQEAKARNLVGAYARSLYESLA